MMLTCQNAGCISGNSFEFSAEEEEWYLENGLSVPPKSCPECRDWKRSQKDETIRCEVCDWVRIISSGQKIMHHKDVGPWEQPTMCRLCEKDPERVARLRANIVGQEAFDETEPLAAEDYEAARRFAMRHHRGSLERAIAAKIGSHITGVAPIDVLTSPDGYKALPHEDGSIYAHIMTDFSELTNDPAARKGHQADLMAALGVESEVAVFSYFGLISQLTSPDRVAEFTQKNGRIVKYDKHTNIMLVCQPRRDGSGQYHVVTAYPPNRAGYAPNKIRSGEWRPLPQKKEDV